MLIFVLVGGFGFFVPYFFFDSIKVLLDIIVGLVEICVVYGGLFGTMFFVFVMGARCELHCGSVFFVVFFVLGGFIFGWFISWGMDGSFLYFVVIANLVLEVLGCLMVVLFFRACCAGASG